MAAVVLFLLYSTFAISAPKCADAFSSKPIPFQNRFVRTNSFNTDRDFYNYQSALDLPERLLRDSIFKSNPEGSIWFDMGAGSGRAIYEALEIGKARIKEVVAVSAVTTLQPYRHKKIQPMTGYLEVLAEKGKLDKYKNQVDVITDVMGVMSYSQDIAAVLRTYLDLLKVGGVIHMNFMLSRESSGHSEMVNQFYRNDQLLQGNILDWLRSSPGIKIIGAKNTIAKNPSGDHKENLIAIVVEKTSENIQLANLKSIYYHESAPPVRYFEIVTEKASGTESKINSEATLRKVKLLHILDNTPFTQRNVFDLKDKFQELGYSEGKALALARIYANPIKSQDLSVYMLIKNYEATLAKDFNSPISDVWKYLASQNENL